MTPQEKQELSEIDICDLFITPVIKDAGWDQLKASLATAQATQLNLADSLVEQAIG